MPTTPPPDPPSATILTLTDHLGADLEHDAVDSQRCRQGDRQALRPKTEQQNPGCGGSAAVRCLSKPRKMDLHRPARSRCALQRLGWKHLLVEDG